MKLSQLSLFLFAAGLTWSVGTQALGNRGAAQSEVKTVEFVELSRYAGTWYQIARNPIIFEWGCECSRQVLTPKDNGLIDVYNTCNFRSPQGYMREIRGTARVVDASSNAKLEVDFGLPWKGDYWVIALDPDYRWAVVTDARKWSLYVLSKTPSLEPELYQEALRQASQQVDTSRLYMTTQEGCWNL